MDWLPFALSVITTLMSIIAFALASDARDGVRRAEESRHLAEQLAYRQGWVYANGDWHQLKEKP